jgi:hypothetical protein
LNVRDAVHVAIQHVQSLFESENLTNLGLEEVEFDHTENEWVVTVGFSRPWDYPKNALAALSNQGGQPRRAFKIVRIRDGDHEVIAVKNRPTDE